MTDDRLQMTDDRLQIAAERLQHTVAVEDFGGGDSLVF
jgi:hypothetical protein